MTTKLLLRFLARIDIVAYHTERSISSWNHATPSGLLIRNISVNLNYLEGSYQELSPACLHLESTSQLRRDAYRSVIIEEQQEKDRNLFIINVWSEVFYRLYAVCRPIERAFKGHLDRYHRPTSFRTK